MTNKLMDKKKKQHKNWSIPDKGHRVIRERESYGYIFIRRHADSLLDDFDIFLGGI